MPGPPRGVASLAGAPGQVDSQDRVSRRVATEEFEGQFKEGNVSRFPRGHAQGLGASAESMEVPIPENRLAVAHPDRLEETVAVKERTIENRHASLFSGQELAVQPDDHGFLGMADGVSGWRLPAAPGDRAERKPRALARVSSYSASGSESATIPAPAP